MSFQPNTAGQYKICGSFNGSSSEPLLMGIKIHSDNMDEPRLETAITKDDVAPLNVKVNDILGEGRSYLSHQESDLDEEDYNSKLQMSSSRNYYLCTIVQVIIIIGLGIYQIFSFRKFLSVNHVI
jgi:hypothetical protein